MSIESYIRPNILSLKPYSSARHEFTGHGEIFLDANENPFETAVNRYPDPMQSALKKVIGQIKDIPTDQIFLGNGSDEAIDLIVRIFCRPGVDEIMILPPTYGMYKVSADISDIEVKKINLNAAFQPEVEEILQQVTEYTKVLFICSPNNPTGNVIARSTIISLLQSFKGIVVIDEAYIDFCPESSCLPMLPDYENLIIMQTFSKAWGMAAVRLGMAFASPDIIGFFNKVKAPYNIGTLTQSYALGRLSRPDEMKAEVQILLSEKKRLYKTLSQVNEIIEAYPSDTNFILVKVKHPEELYQALVAQGIVVRSRAKEPGCEGTLRITIGTPKENEVLMDCIATFKSKELQ